jgi:alkylated DNA repair dioxygenase AlkB
MRSQRAAELQKVSPSELPEGFVYNENFLSAAEQRELIEDVSRLPFQPFDFHGYIAKRRIVEYGFEYDFSLRKATGAAPLPEFLLPIRERAAAFASIAPEQLVEAVVTEYPSGAPIGWHRDVPQFEVVIGISLASSCRMRFKPYKAQGKIVSINLAPGSIYILSRAARWKFQHSIPPVKDLRYSITFRTLRERGTKKTAETE